MVNFVEEIFDVVIILLLGLVHGLAHAQFSTSPEAIIEAGVTAVGITIVITGYIGLKISKSNFMKKIFNNIQNKIVKKKGR